MYKPFINIVFVLYFFLYNAQENIVQNGSFENITNCYGDPAGLGFDVFGWSSCTGWSNPAFSSSDLWCQNPTFGMNVPPNLIGVAYQFPKDGENFAGIFTLDVSNWNYREYIQNELKKELENNNIYEIQFFVNTASIKNQTSCLDLYFSNNKISTNDKILNYVPQFKNNPTNYFNDSLNWIQYKATYKAVGGEKFLTIGCFDDSSKINVLDHNWLTSEGIYLFIDDISITKAPFQFQIPNIFTPNEDNSNDNFIPIVYGMDWNCKIFNRWGNEIIELSNENKSWDGKNCVDGVYFYIFNGKSKDEIFKESGYIQLLR